MCRYSTVPIELTHPIPFRLSDASKGEGADRRRQAMVECVITY